MTDEQAISETVSEKKQRGRPPAFPAAIIVKAMEALEAHGQRVGRRQAVNLLYAASAREALKDFDTDGSAWLMEEAGSTLMAELGRLYCRWGDDELIPEAHSICRSRVKPKPSDKPISAAEAARRAKRYRRFLEGLADDD